jgi:hypothetical protein
VPTLLGFTTADGEIVLVSEYQSIDMHCIVVPVKFDGGLAMSVLRNKGQKFSFSKTFQPRHSEKVPFFLDSLFLVNGIVNPQSNIT